ncbi:MAG: hypothetical protein ACFB4I_15940 [Cyanophyceae cyanobacterium]
MQHWLTKLVRTLPPARELWLPLLFVSTAVHGLLLALPIPSPSDLQPEPEPEETVQITSLVSPTSPPPELFPAPPESTPPQQSQPVSPPQQAQPLPPIEPELPSVLPLEDPPAEAEVEALEPEPAEAASEVPNEEQPVAAAPSPLEAGASLLEELRSRVLNRLAESSNTQQAMETFVTSLPTSLVKSNQQPYFFAGETLKPGAFGFLAIPQTNKAGAYEDYVRPVLTESFGFTVERLPQPYGETELYKAQNAEGIEFYMSLVSLKLGSGAFVVLWQEDPRIGN